jgi:small-conductance mechanosensitive channel
MFLPFLVTYGKDEIPVFIISILAIIIAIILCVINKKEFTEFVKSKMQIDAVKKPVITKILHCIGGGLLSAVIFSQMLYPGIYFVLENIIPFAILILVVICGITIKIVNIKTATVVKLSVLYILTALEYALIAGSGGEFFIADGVGWMILKVAGAAFVLFCQFLLIGSCFKYLDKNFGAFTASTIIGAVAISTAVFAIITAIYLIIIVIVAVVGYIVLKIATADGSSSKGKKRKKGYSVRYGDGTTEEFEEAGYSGPTGETFYKSKNKDDNRVYTEWDIQNKTK